jgi:DNA repair exonuclease SbcCD ATPase subunit
MQELEIANTEAIILSESSNLSTMQASLSDLCTQISDKSKVDGKLTKYATIKKTLHKTITKVNTDIEFYHDNDECPTCKQSITEEYKTPILSERHKKLKEVEDALNKLDSEVEALSSRHAEIEAISLQIDTVNSSMTQTQAEIYSHRRYVENLKKDIERLRESKDDLLTEQSKLKTLNAELVDLETTMKSLSEERAYYDIATSLLKDTGIKTRIIRQYIPVINKLVNKYLASLDFFVNFNLDESFKETIKSRHRDEFTYASFSEGEKQRIDMALMLTWRAVAKLKNSASTNLLILDEIFDSSLDTNGTEELMKILNMLEGENLFVISHKGDILQDKFSHVIKFEKVNSFSRIVK